MRSTLQYKKFHTAFCSEESEQQDDSGWIAVEHSPLFVCSAKAECPFVAVIKTTMHKHRHHRCPKLKHQVIVDIPEIKNVDIDFKIIDLCEAVDGGASGFKSIKYEHDTAGEQVTEIMFQEQGCPAQGAHVTEQYAKAGCVPTNEGTQLTQIVAMNDFLSSEKLLAVIICNIYTLDIHHASVWRIMSWSRCPGLSFRLNPSSLAIKLERVIIIFLGRCQQIIGPNQMPDR